MRKNYRKRTSRKRGGFSKLKREVRKIAKAVYPQNWKYTGNFGANVAFATNISNGSPAATLLNGVATGTTELTRVGDICQLHDIDVRGNIVSTANLTSETKVRVMMIWEGKSALGALASFSGVLDSATPQTFAQRNCTTRDPKRYRILYDKTFGLGIKSTASATPVLNFAAPNIVQFHIKRKLNLVSDYSRGVAGTVADIDTGVLTLFIFTDTGDLNSVSCTGSYQLRFSDS